jgi:hypothetical protein
MTNRGIDLQQTGISSGKFTIPTVSLFNNYQTSFRFEVVSRVFRFFSAVLFQFNLYSLRQLKCFVEVLVPKQIRIQVSFQQLKKQDIDLAEKRMEDWMRRFPTGGEI